MLRTQRPALVQTEDQYQVRVGAENDLIYDSVVTRVLTSLLLIIKSQKCNSIILLCPQFCYRAALEYLGSFDHYAA